MTCKDCIHDGVCLSQISYFMGCDEYTGEEVTDIEQKCSHFKNKADYAEVKQGYWINHYSDLYPADCTQECSICHAEEGGNLWNDNYCPNCGARMDGRSET